MRLLRDVAGAAVPPAVLFVLVLFGWHLGTELSGVERYLLPPPSAVAQAAWEDRGMLVNAIALTSASAVCGFLLSLTVGTCIAIVFSFSRLVRTSCYPYAIFMQTVPIVAIAPLIVVWFGYGFRSVVLVAFIISLFPIITNATTGLTSIDQDLLDLFRLHNASRSQLLFKLQLPLAVPYIVTGARISSGMAIVGSIVGEFFTGYGSANFGLGYLIMQSTNLLRTDELFAAVLASTGLGVIVFALVNLIGATILVRWYPEQ